MDNRKQILLIGYGAIGSTVSLAMGAYLRADVSHVLVKPGREINAKQALGSDKVYMSELSRFLDSSPTIDVVADCAGHVSLSSYGPQLLAAGIDVYSLSCGALADAALAEELESAAEAGSAQLRLLSGAIGGLDALSAGSVGGLDKVVYRGCKPPKGWKGSAAEEALDLDTVNPRTSHFTGPARRAASQYPKNANVAASVALAGTGFELTEVELLVDPSLDVNVHELEANGSFGSLSLRIEGKSLESNPRSSALAAFSMIRALKNRYAAICLD